MSRKAMQSPKLESDLRSNGYAILPILTADDLAQLRDIYQSAANAHNQGFMASVLLDDVALRRRINDAVQSVFNRVLLPHLNNFKMVVGSIASKEPNSDTSSVGIHQDLTFVDERIEGNIGLSIWAPLQNVTPENGCLSVAPGSHLLNSNWRDPSGLPYHDLIPLIENAFMQEVPMKAGEVMLMDNRLFHASPPNRTSQARAVGAGIAVPAESPIHYVHRDYAGDASMVEIWQVPEDFYVSHMIGMRPTSGTHLATISGQPEPLDEVRLRASLTPVSVLA